MNHPTSAAQSAHSAHDVIGFTERDAERIKDHEELVWFESAPGVTATDQVETIDWSRTRGVELEEPRLGEDQHERPLAGFYSAWAMGVTVPGPENELRHLPMDGLTMVGVHPDQRRRGILRAMMTDHLHQIHDRSEAAVAGLHASEPAIYGRYGYGAATLDAGLTLGRGSTLHAPPEVSEAAEKVQLHTVKASTDEGARVLHQAHVACAKSTLGAVTRADSVERSWFRDFPTVRGHKEPRRVMVARREGHITGYAVFRRTSKWSEHDNPEGQVVVSELGATDRASLLAISRRLLDFDLTTTVKIYGRGIDDPLVWWAGGPRAAQMIVSDSLWVRIVDLPRALTERGYAAPCDIVMHVTDDICGWNAGTWRLTVDSQGRGQCHPADGAEADLRLPIAALGAAYVGGHPLAAQASAGSITEHRPGAVRELSRAMQADTAPMGAIGF